MGLKKFASIPLILGIIFLVLAFSALVFFNDCGNPEQMGQKMIDMGFPIMTVGFLVEIFVGVTGALCPIWRVMDFFIEPFGWFYALFGFWLYVMLGVAFIAIAVGMILYLP